MILVLPLVVAVALVLFLSLAGWYWQDAPSHELRHGYKPTAGRPRPTEPPPKPSDAARSARPR